MDFTRRRLLKKINIALLVFLSAGAVLFALSLRGSGSEGFPVKSREAPPAMAETEPKSLEYFAVIEKSGLFGRRSGPEPKRPAPVRSPAEPRLELKGTVIFSSGGGYAIIRNTETGEEITAAVGSLINGMELLSLDWNSAVLVGERGKVFLSMDAESGGDQTPSAASARGRRERRERDFTVPASRIDEAIENAPRLLREVQVRPNITEAGTEGFALSGIRPGTLPDEFGLKDGDIITRVNRINLDGPDSVMRVYGEIMRRGFASVEVLRGGERVNFSYRIEK